MLGCCVRNGDVHRLQDRLAAHVLEVRGLVWVLVVVDQVRGSVRAHNVEDVLKVVHDVDPSGLAERGDDVQLLEQHQL